MDVCTPWEARLEAGKMILESPPLLDAGDLELFDKWCIAQSQRAGKENPLAAINLKPMMRVDGKISKWKRDRLEGTLRPSVTMRGQPQQLALPMTPSAGTNQPDAGPCPYTQVTKLVTNLTHQFTNAVKPIMDAHVEQTKR